MSLTQAFSKFAAPRKPEEIPAFLDRSFANVQRAIPVGLSIDAGAPDDNAGIDGNYYLRTDTPGVANQRLYVKDSGVWVGIV